MDAGRARMGIRLAMSVGLRLAHILLRMARRDPDDPGGTVESQ